MAQQVLGKIQLRVGEEARLQHVLAVGQRDITFLAKHTAIVPHGRPERGTVLDRPAIELIIIAKSETLSLATPLHEPGERMGSLEGFRRCPKG